MKLIIDIPEVFYEALRETDVIISGQRSGKTLMSVIYNAVANGTPLPKGHGRLIDYGYVVDAIDDWVNAEEYRYTNATDYLRKRVANTPAIIEADKAESEEGMTIDEKYRFSYGAQRIDIEKGKQERIKGHCEDCKHFRELPYHADTLGKCFQHTGLFPKGDWYCADFESLDRRDKE